MKLQFYATSYTLFSTKDEFDKTQHKIILSVSAYYTKREKTELDEFLAKHSTITSTSIADAMPEELKQVAKESTEDSSEETE